MSVQQSITLYENSLKHLLPLLKDFEEKDADFAPADGAMTVVQQMRHTALTVEWFWEGAFGKGFSEDWEAFVAATNESATVKESVDFIQKVHTDCIEKLKNMSDEELSSPMADNAIMGPIPKIAVVHATADHTAHHRGSLAVYLRMTGKTPKMIYAD